MGFSRPTLTKWFGPFTSSLALHALVVGGALSLGQTPLPRESFVHTVAIEVVEMPRGSAVQTTEPQSSNNPPAGTQAPPQPKVVPPAKTPPSTKASSDNQVVDLQNVVLSNPSAEANNTEGPARPTAGSAAPPGAGSGGGPSGVVGVPDGVVGAKSLSRRPQPLGNIRRALERNYPPRAQSLGIEGKAQVRVRVFPNGKPDQMTLAFETGNVGFGTACLKTLAQSRWSPALDRKGTPVATDISFTCVFEIRY
ncbi:MAG: TonB family protein [Myxococcales bacterium]|nr:TonB family protein [Myxococcales bacterium]MCB9708778.1 TonB family protein [Myxococcales bacterium]